jgi:APA family basic amino acid/polyamine antiporter
MCPQLSRAGSTAAPPDGTGLVAQSCGTAVASVCAIGLFQIEQLLGGLWSLAAVAVAAGVCLLLARRLGRLAVIIPSAAGLLAQLSRGLGQKLALLLVLPYLVLTLFLVGSESTLAGLLAAEVSPLPAPAAAVLLLGLTWAVCRSGRRASVALQAAATWTLMGGLALLSLVAMLQAARAGLLVARLLPAAPTPLRFCAGIGQALFLFMGFELISFQPHAAAGGRLGPTLQRSVLLLAAFYTLVALGFCCLREPPRSSGGFFVPQLAMARQAGGTAAAFCVVGVSLLASYASFNGALLSLSRFAQALASQGLLPRLLIRLDPRTRVPERALDGLLIICVAAMAVVRVAHLLQPSILAAAVAVALVYGGAALARERAPFREPERRLRHSAPGLVLGSGLFLLGLGVVIDAGDAGRGGHVGASAVLNAPWAVRGLTLALLGTAYGAASLLALRRWQQQQRAQTRHREVLVHER